MVFFFTATGNSLHVAKQLDENAISIAQVIHQDNLSFRDDSIGIVCPIYGHEVPLMVKDFISRSNFETNYFYLVLTYGNRHGGAAELAHEMMDGFGIKAAYINTIKMIDNFLPAFDMNDQIQIDKNEAGQLAEIKADITARRSWIQPAAEADREAHQSFLSRSTTPPGERWKDIYAVTDACTGCGICEKVCPAGCWEVKNGKGSYVSHNCQSCMACIHACPQKAIQLKIPEINPQARYRNAHITLAEIIGANQQVTNQG